MHITPYKAMYFPNFIFLRKRLKSSHTSLKKLEKEDFNSINRYFISSLGDASPPGEDASPQVRTRPQRTYIYTHEITPFMFFNTKHKKIILIICSFKAESVLLPCYSFPAKKSLKKVSCFKSLVYNVLRV